MHHSLKEKCLERQKWNNRAALSTQTFLMFGWRSIFSSMLRLGVGRCRETIAVCDTADLRFKGLIRHILYSTILWKMEVKELSSSHYENDLYSCFFLWYLISISQSKHRRSRRTTASNPQITCSLTRLFCHLVNPSAGASALAHVRMWHWLRGAGARHRLTQQSRHLASQCERPAAVGRCQQRRESMKTQMFTKNYYLCSTSSVFSRNSMYLKNSLAGLFPLIPHCDSSRPPLLWSLGTPVWFVGPGVCSIDHKSRRSMGGFYVLPTLFLHFKQTSGHRLHLQSLISSDQTGADKRPLQMSPKSPVTDFSELL